MLFRCVAKVIKVMNGIKLRYVTWQQGWWILELIWFQYCKRWHGSKCPNTAFLVPAEEKLPHSMMLSPPPCFTWRAQGNVNVLWLVLHCNRTSSLKNIVLLVTLSQRTDLWSADSLLLVNIDLFLICCTSFYVEVSACRRLNDTTLFKIQVV